MNNNLITLTIDETKQTLSAEEIQQLFLEFFYEKQNGYFLFMRRLDDNTPHDQDLIFYNQSPPILHTREDRNNYISPNLFSFSDKALMKNVSVINAFVIDIDVMHKKLKPYDIQIANPIMEQVEQLINELVDRGKIPRPSAHMRTGCGINYIYKLHPITENSEFFRSYFKSQSNKVYDLLQLFINERFGDMDIDVDHSLGNVNRCIRLPESMHQTAHQRCKLISLNHNITYELDDLFKQFGVDDFTPPSVSTSKKKRLPTSLNGDKKQLLIQSFPTFKNRDHLGEYRAKIIYKYIKDYGMTYFEKCGRRKVLFVYANCVLLFLKTEDAINQTFELNEMFAEPMSQNEILNIFEGIYNNPGHIYKLTDENITEQLDLTYDEACSIGLFHKVDRQKQAEKSRNQKQERNELIAKLSCDQNLSYQQIAKKAGCSLSTVKRVLKNNDYNRYHVSKQSKKDESINFAALCEMYKENK